MEKITIELSQNSHVNIEKFLSKEEYFFEGINIEITPNKIIYFTENKSKKELIYKIAHILTNCIIEIYEKGFISNILINSYFDFTKIERARIVEIAKNIIECDDNILDKMFYIRRKNYIYERLIEYLEVDNHIILEGFITFRLKDYKKDLEKIVERAVDMYITETEYNEFINLLKYFVNIQDSKIDVVYLTLYTNGSYELCDKTNNDVSYLYIEEMQEEILSSKLSKEDILLGALITISPKKIIIKKEDETVLESEIFNTINSVFDDRITFLEN